MRAGEPAVLRQGELLLDMFEISNKYVALSALGRVLIATSSSFRDYGVYLAAGTGLLHLWRF